MQDLTWAWQMDTMHYAAKAVWSAVFLCKPSCVHLEGGGAPVAAVAGLPGCMRLARRPMTMLPRLSGVRPALHMSAQQDC